MTHGFKITWKTAAVVVGFLLIAVMFVMPRSVRAEEVGQGEIDGIIWSLDKTGDNYTLELTAHTKDIINATFVQSLNNAVFALAVQPPSNFEGFDIVINEGITAINSKAFEGKKMRSVTLPQSMDTIQDKAFYNCSQLVTVTTGNNMFMINDSAFELCTSLTAFVIPSTLEYIGNRVFYSCVNLNSLEINNTTVDFGLAIHSSTTGSEGMSFTYAGSKALAKDKGLRYIVEKAGDNATFAKVRVTYKYNNGDSDTYSEKAVGSTFTKPSDPSYSGKLFNGWLSGDESGHTSGYFDFSKPVNSDVYLYADWVADETTVLAGYSLSLEGDIGVNFYIQCASTLPDSTKVTLSNTVPAGRTANTAEYTVGAPSGTAKVGNITYKLFKLNVAPSTMTCPITVTVGDEVLGNSFTVRDYAAVILKNEDNNAEYAAKEGLVKAMLNFGAYSQKHFDVNTGDLANYVAGVDDFDNVKDYSKMPKLEISVTSRTTSELPDDWPFEYYGSGLDLDDKITAYVYFKVPSDLDLSKYTIQVNSLSTGFTVTRNNDYFVCVKREITAADLNNPDHCVITIMMSNDPTGAHYAYYPALFCSAVNYSNDASIPDSLKNLAKALYLYGAACGS